VEACVAGIAVASHSPRADEVCLLISLDEARVAGDIARPLLRHAKTDVKTSSLELRGNVDTVGGSDFESREADSKNHGDWLAILVDVGRRRGIFLDVGVVVVQHCYGDAALRRVGAGDVVFDNEAEAILFCRCLDLIQDLGWWSDTWVRLASRTTYTHRDKGLVADRLYKSLHNHAVDAVLLQPLEVQVDNALARAVIELGRLAVWQRELSIEKATSRILADVWDEVNLNYQESVRQGHSY
jgi:hypothetical protein